MKNINLIHNNEDYYPECHVFSDEKYDYAIVNGESLTRYFGPSGGNYESYPLHMLAHRRWIMKETPWLIKLLEKDLVNTRLYRHWDRIQEDFDFAIKNKIK